MVGRPSPVLLVEAAKIVRNHDLQPCGRPDRPQAALLGPRAACSGGRLSLTLGTMSLAIVPTAECHFEGLRLALDAVARERRYLAITAAPPREEALAFYRNIVANDLCQFVAVQDGIVIGWCDILPIRGEACTHIGVLGMGLVSHARHLGIGTRLLDATISKAWAKGLSRIALTVRADNANAKALYERFGFVSEGLLRRAFRIDGEFFDCYAMALLR